jgi:hypothetical protein
MFIINTLDQNNYRFLVLPDNNDWFLIKYLKQINIHLLQEFFNNFDMLYLD